VVIAVAIALVAAAVLWGCGATGGGPGGSGSSTAPPQPSPSASPSKKPQTPAPSPTAGQGAGAGPAARATRVVFIDVGQGDAAAVRSGKWSGLIDGGPAGSEEAVEAALRRLGVRRLSAVAVSHMHADHIGALPHLIEEWRPRAVYVASAPTAALRSACAAAGAKVTRVAKGSPAMRWGAATAKVLSPAGLSDDANEDSMVVLLEAAGRRFLFTGDCTGPNEAAVGVICARGPPVTVLKVAHHGSRYSTSRTFLAEVRPRAAVISVGSNSYGHPTAEALASLRRAGATVYTTWKNGTITFTVGASGTLKRSFTRASQPVKSRADALGGS
jgi:competence protein ComEC